VADGAGNLYVADGRNNTIRKVVVQSGVVTTLAGAARLTGSTDGTGAAARFKSPVGVAADGANNLYIADTFNNTIRKVVVQSGVVTTLAGTAGVYGSADGTGAAAKFVTPQGVAADGAGNLYVADSGNNTIRKVVVQSGVVTTLAGTAGMAGSTDGTGAAALFNVPQGVAVDAAGNLYVADTFNHTIRKVVVQSGVVTTLAGTAGMAGSADGTGSAALFNYPQGVAVDGAGNVYVADSGNNTIRKVVVQSGLVTTLAGTVGMTGSTDGTGSAALFSTPLGVAVDGAGNLYISDSVNRTLRKMALSSGSVTTLVGAAGQQGVKLGQLRGSLNSPAGVAVTSAGVLFIVDKSENAVLAVR
jgi:sugar lactone lactonase YvrE